MAWRRKNTSTDFNTQYGYFEFILLSFGLTLQEMYDMTKTLFLKLSSFKIDLHIATYRFICSFLRDLYTVELYTICLPLKVISRSVISFSLQQLTHHEIYIMHVEFRVLVICEHCDENKVSVHFRNITFSTKYMTPVSIPSAHKREPSELFKLLALYVSLW